ncbi:MAG: hydratase [Christensenellales bacterium]|jgi:aconitate hydratase
MTYKNAITLHEGGAYLIKGQPVFSGENLPKPSDARQSTMAYGIMSAHDQSDRGDDVLRLKFDALASHDITYVGIIQTAKASGLKEFPVPYAMTNCHNSLCAVGGTINEDDHAFGLSAAIKYGGIFVPPNLSVIHMYAREALSKCGGMVLGSDSHTRYGALGTMGFGEGGPELAKQLLKNTYDIKKPEVVMVYLENAPKPGVGPHDVAIALVGAVFANGFVKNKVMEFVGPGVKNLNVDFRNGIDVMTTETACLSSIWETDEQVQDYYYALGRPGDFSPLSPGEQAYYDGVITVDLAKIECMIAMPFHPSNAFTIKELNENAGDILSSIQKDTIKQFGAEKGFDIVSKLKDGRIYADQGVIAGCAGGIFDNLCDAAAILDGGSTGSGYFSLSVYPGSMPVGMAIARNGVMEKLMAAGAVVKPAFCGPCFGAGDVPANNGLSIRHTTRNFPNREGSVPDQGQLASVALMDARSIAATAINGGAITPATDLDIAYGQNKYEHDNSIYEKRVYNGFGNAKPEEELRFGPNITEWPKMHEMEENLLLELAAVIDDPVTTTDELIPSGETSSYRSNPLRLAEFALSRRVPGYVAASKAVKAMDDIRRAGKAPEKTLAALEKVSDDAKGLMENTAIGSCVFANKPGDGSAREQAASCQRVLGGMANICYEYATKRYRSNLINWGMVPFRIGDDTKFDYSVGDFVYVPGIRSAIESGAGSVSAKVITKQGVDDIQLIIDPLTDDEKTIILEGCLMYYYASKNNG